MMASCLTNKSVNYYILVSKMVMQFKLHKPSSENYAYVYAGATPKCRPLFIRTRPHVDRACFLR